MGNHSLPATDHRAPFRPFPRRLRVLPVALALAVLLLCAAAGLGAAKLTISVIDVGHGDAILVQFPNGDEMLVDAGKQGASKKVVEYLDRQGVDDLELLVATHPDEDHIGGIPNVLASRKVAKAWISGYEPDKLTGDGGVFATATPPVVAEKPIAGQQMSFGGATVTVVAPLTLRSFSNVNDNSVVLRITYGNTSALLTGDMEKKERASITSWQHADVLKVAHHGSENGTDTAFIQALKPKFAVISDDRKQGNGSDPVGPLLTAQLGDYYSTAGDGTVVFVSDGTSFQAYPPHGSTTTAPPGQVYTTSGGSKYHRADCRYLGASRRAMTKAEAVAKGYSPCRSCMQ